MDTTALQTQDAWLEECLGSTEALVANGDDLTVGKFIGFLQARALGCGLDLLLEVESNIAELLLDVTNDFALGSGRESISALSQDLHEVIRQVTTSHINTGDSVWQSETFVDGDDVGDAITGVKDDTSCATRGIERQNSLDRNVESWGIEGLENDLGHLLAVRLWVNGSFGEQDWVFLRSDTQFVVEGVMPDLLHVIPVGDNTMLDRVSQSENTTLGLCLIADIGVLLTHANHDTVSRQLKGFTGNTARGRWKTEQLTHGDEGVQQLMLE